MGEPGWEGSAAAWIEAMGEQGDWSRKVVLDPVMLARARRLAGAALDVGCGEGRFCRLLQGLGFSCTGVDPTPSLISAARERDPSGDYHIGFAEELPFADQSFDLVVTYLSLIDIFGMRSAVAEMARVLRSGGHLLAANLTSLNSAGQWIKGPAGEKRVFGLDRYSEERPVRQRWGNIDIVNWHRPLSTYMDAFLGSGMVLSFFNEPLPPPEEDITAGCFARAPWFLVMEWRKPEAAA